ncbi:ankyrin repeat domain-containing protein 13B-like, partial [Pseudonaja textilis]|uniref:ankyrin repeat domain-containing protein 13B-like n=1 Tax=Pseudonaja textilis TaxID=8673 RepID=UPI000EAAB838
MVEDASCSARYPAERLVEATRCASEIPIFHILNARITFGNLNGCDEPVVSLRTTGSPGSDAPSPGSDRSSISSSSSLGSCRCFEMDPSLFEAPQGYSIVGRHPEPLREDEDDLLQFAIQQSLLEAGSEYDQVGENRPGGAQKRGTPGKVK